MRTAGERTFFRRLKEGLTGEGAARQNAINASVAQGLEASLRWLTELTTSLATTNYAITRVNDRVSSLVSDTAGWRIIPQIHGSSYSSWPIRFTIN
ncbi:diguanylate cyclase regulator RdcB family protein [Escherichia coli]|uniref:diguanylate cyclase regulator RdcB family protein n=1 Tax=Escherichia coli TaxID=562 RepID=UPI003315789D